MLPSLCLGEKDAALVAQIKVLATEYFRYGYRRIWALLRRESWIVIWRLWKLLEL